MSEHKEDERVPEACSARGVSTHVESHTKGKWSVPHLSLDGDGCKCGFVLNDGYMGCLAEVSVDNGKPVSDGGNDAPPAEEARANGILIANAPSMWLVLEMIRFGCATGDSGGIVFDGIRYPVVNGDYSDVVDLIGYRRCVESVAARRGTNA